MRIIVFIVLSFAIFTPHRVTAQYKVSFSNNYPPYNYLNKEGELVGFNIDILIAINKLYANKIEISGNNWQTINHALESNKTQAIGGTHYPGNPENNYTYTRSTINTSHCFLYNTNYVKKFSIEYLRSFKQPLVALWKNDVLAYYIRSINPSAHFIYAKDYEELLQLIEREDVCCALAQRIGSMYYARELGKDFIGLSKHRILERNMGFKVSKESPELANIINNGIEVLLSNGEYQHIYDKWIADYNKDSNDWHNYLKYILLAGILTSVVFLMLLIVNQFLQSKVKSKTKDLHQQLQLNSQIMIELEKQKFKAEESDKMKSAFLANMSHEIRTPMNGIIGFAELLKSKEFSSEEQDQFIGIILQSGGRMLDTINNIIDVSKLESGAEKKQIDRVSINSIMHELQNFFTTEANSKGLKLLFNEVGSPSKKDFYTDEYKLNSILTNLIKNAIKFTAKGEIQVRYSVGENRAEFTVSDTGIGIAKEKQRAIFNQFVQADSSHSSGYEGSGLGLSISKGYAKLLGGDIQLESESGKGTTFFVKIPNCKKETPPAIATNHEHYANEQILN